MASLDRGRRGYPEEERLPWLEEVPAEPVRNGIGIGRALLLLLVAAIVVGLAVLAYRWPFGTGPDGSGTELIRAPAGPYKIKPAEPGGMDVEGTGSAAYAASEGGDPRGAIDLSAMPETPVARGTRPAVPASPPAAAGAANGSVQLGAFSSEAKARAAWKALSQRFSFLTPFEPVVLPAKVGDATVYRLRAPVGPSATAYCARLKVAGETCLVVDG